MSDSELQVRIALMEYYSSLMQGYKTYVLTFGVAILTAFEVWFRIPKLATTNFLMSFLLGAIVSAIIISCFRFLWCGRIVTSAIRSRAPLVPTMGNFDDQIKSYAHEPTNWTEPIKGLSRRSRIERRAQRCWVQLIMLGDSKILLASVYVAAVLVLGSVICYFFDPLFGIACTCPLGT